MKIILGSGITGLLAKSILGEDWTVVPFYKSRFYSYNPPLCDNFVIADPQIDAVFRWLGLPVATVPYRRAFSAQGQLSFQDGGLSEAWLHKLFRGQPPSHSLPYMKARNLFFVYEKVRSNKLYLQLQERYKEELQREAQLGEPTAIRDHQLVRGKLVQDYTHAISTIPLGKLYGLLGRQARFRYGNLHYLHMQSQHLNFEGASQVLVVDPMFSFFKVSALAQDRYLFYCHEEIPNPGQYFLPIIEDYDLLDGTMIQDALIMGELPDVSWLDAEGIFPVGAFAQHDYCADVGSNVLRLLRYAERNFAHKQGKIIVAD